MPIHDQFVQTNWPSKAEGVTILPYRRDTEISKHTPLSSSSGRYSMALIVAGCLVLGMAIGGWAEEKIHAVVKSVSDNSAMAARDAAAGRDQGAALADQVSAVKAQISTLQNEIRAQKAGDEARQAEIIQRFQRAFELALKQQGEGREALLVYLKQVMADVATLDMAANSAKAAPAQKAAP